jgi:ribosomal protein L37AE/L43A
MLKNWILYWKHSRKQKLEKCDEEWAYMFNVYKTNQVGKQEAGIWWAQKHFPRYGVPIWSLWQNIRSLPSIVAEKNAMKNDHICSMCIKINKVGKQEAGIWWAQKHFPRYGVPIWSLWPNIRSLPSIVAEKNAMKNEHICSMCIKINKVGKQEVGIWWVQKCFPRFYIKLVTKYQISAINSYWEKCDEKYLGRTEVKQYTPLPLRGV